MRLKFILSILISLAFLAACQGPSTPTVSLPAIEPSIRGLAAPEIDQPTTDAIRQNMALFLNSDPFTEYQAGS